MLKIFIKNFIIILILSFCSSEKNNSSNLKKLLAAYFFSANQNPSGIIYSGNCTVSTFVGNGKYGSVDGTGTSAGLYSPAGVAFDSKGNLIIADYYKIRKSNPDSVVTTIAGSGTRGSADGIGDSASFQYARQVALDSNDNIYVGDGGSIRKISTSGVVTTFIGNIYIDGIAYNSKNNNFYVSSGVSSGGWINTIAIDGTVSTFVAASSPYTYTNPGGINCHISENEFGNQLRVTIDLSGNIIASDFDCNLIRKITPSGNATIIAGRNPSSGIQAYGTADGNTTNARFKNPSAIAVDSKGNIIIGDTGNYRIRKIDTNNYVTTLAGTGSIGSTDGPGYQATFALNYSYDGGGIAVDSSNTIYVADSRNYKIRKIVCQ